MTARRAVLAGCALVLAALAALPAQARTVCTIIADANNGAVLQEEGDCRSRVTPASTFKIALALMGYDAGILTSAQQPALPFKPGYADWGGKNWQQTTTPLRWMAYSVVWYSQQIARDLGVERLSSYASRFSYGNGDFSGDPGRNNGLERAWISSSLTISPFEQTQFLHRFLTAQLPVSPQAIQQTAAIVEHSQAGDGWTVWGKTGSAYPRKADGTFDRAHGWGWFVGWAKKGETTLVFARLNQDERRNSQSGGLRARAAFLEEWPQRAAEALRP